MPDAITIAQKLIDKYPNNQEIIKLNAKLYFWNKDITAAYKYAVKLKNKNSNLYKNINTSYQIYLLEKITDSNNKLSKIKLLDDDLQFWSLRGILFLFFIL